MSLRILFEGQAIKSEMVVLMLEKWDLHPQMEEKDAKPNVDDLARDTRRKDSRVIPVADCPLHMRFVRLLSGH